MREALGNQTVGCYVVLNSLAAKGHSMKLGGEQVKPGKR